MRRAELVQRTGLTQPRASDPAARPLPIPFRSRALPGRLGKKRLL
jgi:hypothetical protein